MEELLPHRWKLIFETREDEDHCDMVVHLDAGDRSLSGHGRSRRNPNDPSLPQIGEELAAARAAAQPRQSACRRRLEHDRVAPVQVLSGR